MTEPEQDLQRPPWGTILKRARESWRPRRLSMRAAAVRAGVAETTWRHAEGGYEPKAGMRLPYRVGAPTLANMAEAVGVTPDELRGAGRSDAAEILEDIAARDGSDADLVAECDHERRLLMSGDISEGEKRRRILRHRDEGHADWCGRYDVRSGTAPSSGRAIPTGGSAPAESSA